MIAQVLTVFAVICFAFSAYGLHLRSDFATPAEDQATAERAFRSFMKNAAQKQNANHKVMELETKSLFSANNHNVKVVNLQQSSQTIDHGYLISRYRPNADCSGPATNVFAKSGECRVLENDLGEEYSEAITCTRNKPAQELMLTIHRFNNNDCTGEPYENTQRTMDKCSFDGDAAPVPGTVGLQCVGLNDAKIAQKGGLVIYTYFDAACTASPDGFAVSGFGGCELTYDFYDDQGVPTDEVVFNQHTRYSYFRLDGCHDTKIGVSLYADSACTRQTLRATIDVADTFPYGRCEYQEEWRRYGTAVCVPAPSHM
jgi:hypothetical protein